MMRKQDVSLKVPERILELNEGWLPVADYFEIRDDFVKIFIRIPFFIAAKRSSCVIRLGLIIEDPGNQDDCDCMIRPSLSPLGKQSW